MPAQAHERVAVLHRDAGRVRLDHERRDAAALTVVLGNAGHHHDEFGDHAVRRPQLHAVEQVRLAVVGRRRGRRHPRRVGADIGLGQQERGHRTTRTARQEALLLLIGAELLHRLRYADRLVRGHQRTESRVHRPDQHQRAPVVRHRQAESAVLGRNLHAEHTQVGESLQILVRDAGLALDQQAVEGLAVRREPAEELVPADGVVGRGAWMRMDQRQVEVARGTAPWRSSVAPTPSPGPPQQSPEPPAHQHPARPARQYSHHTPYSTVAPSRPVPGRPPSTPRLTTTLPLARPLST